jgi:hypothetical protein
VTRKLTSLWKWSAPAITVATDFASSGPNSSPAIMAASAMPVTPVFIQGRATAPAATNAPSTTSVRPVMKSNVQVPLDVVA